MQALGEQPSDAEMKVLIARINYNQDSECDLDEFICLMVIYLTKSQNDPEELVEVFKRFDKSGTGQITAHDLIEIFEELGTGLDFEEAQDMIFCLDKNKDGTINFQEFIETMMYEATDTSVVLPDKKAGHKK